MVMSFALTAGIGYTEARNLPVGEVIDLYLFKRKYDDQQHGIKREE